MGSRESKFAQAAWDQQDHHQPGQAARGQEKKEPPGEEDPIVLLEPNADFPESAVASEPHKDGG